MKTTYMLKKNTEELWYYYKIECYAAIKNDFSKALLIGNHFCANYEIKKTQ